MTSSIRPLTERRLTRLPGRRIVWIVLWALVPWMNAGLNLLLGTSTSAVWEQSAALVILNYAAISFAVVMSLWGTGRIARQLETLLANAGELSSLRHFRGMDSAAGPLLLSVAAAIAFGLPAYFRDGGVAGLLRGGTWFVLGIALFTFLWTYGSLLFGLNRLGRERLITEAMHVDPGLGLEPLGAIASTGLWMLLAWLVPVFLTGLPDVVGAVTGTVVLIVVLATFFLSLLRLHWQMVEGRRAS
ncbi:MAG TPA: hypothetical protein VHJ58_21185 [Vicinamibacterales bacterium]|nr:hypothetical protein [Vicinamibacterales bacterium]